MDSCADVLCGVGRSARGSNGSSVRAQDPHDMPSPEPLRWASKGHRVTLRRRLAPACLRRLVAACNPREVTEHPPINLELLRPSRRRLAAGDVFVVKPIRHPFLFGRIIRTDAALFGQGNLLLYFYDAWSDDAQDIPALARDRLLIPPVVTNRLGWSRGFFNHVENRPLTRGDVLSVHCFVSNVYRDGPRYFDEFRNQLPGPVPPVGEAGLHSYRTIDDEISRALGIPLAPEE